MSGTSSSTKKLDGSLTENPQEKSDILNKFFASVFTVDDQPEHSAFVIYLLQWHFQFTTVFYVKLCYVGPIYWIIIILWYLH